MDVCSYLLFATTGFATKRKKGDGWDEIYNFDFWENILIVLVHAVTTTIRADHGGVIPIQLKQDAYCNWVCSAMVGIDIC